MAGGATVRAVVSALAVTAVAGSLLAGCGSDKRSGLEKVADSYASALEKRDASKAANLTTSPVQAGEAIDATLRGVDPERVDVEIANPVSYSDGSGSFTLKTTWDIGTTPHAGADAPHRTFVTTSQATARHLSAGWRLQWNPSLIYPGLQPGGSLQVIDTAAKPVPKVVAADRSTWMAQQPVNTVTIAFSKTPDPVGSARALSADLAPVAPAITTEVIRKAGAAANGAPATVVSLRDDDLAALPNDPATIPGVAVTKGSDLLVLDRRLNTPLSAGVKAAWQDIRDATSGWQARMVNPNAAPVIIDQQQGKPGPNLTTTFDPNTQLVLEDSVVEVAQPAAMMVLNATTGGIQAAAFNSAASAGDLSLTDSYLVGRTLDPVRAAIDAGANGDDKKRGAITDTLGLGLSFQVPGVQAVGQTVQASSSTSSMSVVPVSFDKSDPKSTMLGMGALGLAIAQGKTVLPSFVTVGKTKVTGGDPGTVDPKVNAAINAAMKTTAATGDASDLVDAPGLRALVGTNGPQGPGWFLGIQGNRVVVIYCEGEKSGTASLAVAQRYFREMR